jgi:hypothetical protein
MMGQQMGRGGGGIGGGRIDNPQQQGVQMRQPMVGMQMKGPQHQQQKSSSQERSEEEKPDLNQQPAMGIKKKLQIKPDQKHQEDPNKVDGSDNGDSQNDSQGRPGGQYYDYRGGYGMAQPPPYSYSAGYNYQMPPHPMNQGYSLYPSHHPSIPYDKLQAQRPPQPKQFAYPAYNYQQDARAYPPVPRQQPQANYGYEQYSYGEQEPPRAQMQPIPQLPKPPGEYRPEKRKQPTVDRQPNFPSYQYDQPQGNPMYPNMHMAAHYEHREPYEFSGYKGKPESSPVHSAQSFYNYKTPTSQPYSYGGYKEPEQPEDKNLFREDQKARRGGVQAPKPEPPKLVSKPKPKQFAEDNDKQKE